MGVYTVAVDVATCRPPRADATIRVVVQADNDHDAVLAACQIAMCHPAVVMPVASTLLAWPTD